MGPIETLLGCFDKFYIGAQGVSNSFQDFLFQVLLRLGVETHPNWGICNVFLVRVEFFLFSTRGVTPPTRISMDHSKIFFLFPVGFEK
jgi:hypothetical protein